MTRAYQAVIAVLVLSSCLTSEGGDLDAGVDITKEGSPSTTAPAARIGGQRCRR